MFYQNPTVVLIINITSNNLSNLKVHKHFTQLYFYNKTNTEVVKAIFGVKNSLKTQFARNF